MHDKTFPRFGSTLPSRFLEEELMTQASFRLEKCVRTLWEKKVCELVLQHADSIAHALDGRTWPYVAVEDEVDPHPDFEPYFMRADPALDHLHYQWCLVLRRAMRPEHLCVEFPDMANARHHEDIMEDAIKAATRWLVEMLGLAHGAGAKEITFLTTLVIEESTNQSYRVAERRIAPRRSRDKYLASCWEEISMVKGERQSPSARRHLRENAKYTRAREESILEEILPIVRQARNDAASAFGLDGSHTMEWQQGFVPFSVLDEHTLNMIVRINLRPRAAAYHDEAMRCGFETWEFHLSRERLLDFMRETYTNLVVKAGSEQERRDLKVDEQQRPEWTIVTTPMMKALLGRAGGVPHRDLASDGPIVHTSHGTCHMVNEQMGYRYDHYDDEEIFIIFRPPEAIRSNLAGKPLREVVEGARVPSDATIKETRSIRNDEGDELLEVVIPVSPLVRMGSHMIGVDPDPMKAWANAARRALQADGDTEHFD